MKQEPWPVRAENPHPSGRGEVNAPEPPADERAGYAPPPPSDAGSPAGPRTRGRETGPAGKVTEPRTFTIELPAGMDLLSLNRRMHWAEKNRRTRELKKAAWAITRMNLIPHLERASIAVEYQPPDRRHRDADNAGTASGKACIDGIVAAGVLDDDECPRYVTDVRYTIGPVFPRGRLVLHVTEVAA